MFDTYNIISKSGVYGKLEDVVQVNIELRMSGAISPFNYVLNLRDSPLLLLRFL